MFLFEGVMPCIFSIHVRKTGKMILRFSEVGLFVSFIMSSACIGELTIYINVNPFVFGPGDSR